MAAKLLVRTFDVGLGDCIYCRIPGAHTSARDFHILVDCGSLSGSQGLKDAIDKLKTTIPADASGKHPIDLLVVTHEHKDHMTGFGLKIWDDFQFGAIWMNAAMDPKHPEAKRAQKLHNFAAAAMANAVRLKLALSPQLTELAEALALNADAMKNLRQTLPARSGISAKYVHAASTKTDLKLPLLGASIRVLGPERDIDYYYLGKPGDPNLRFGLRSALSFIDDSLPSPDAAVPDKVATPTNLDAGDFRQLRSRMLSTAFSFADLAGKVCNNTSVILLIEWNGKRLLFVGDAEWDGAFKDGAKSNCSWNVMWNRDKTKILLDAPVSFLKIGHHGSTNATPWQQPDVSTRGEPLAILDAILPVTNKAKAKAIISTRRGNYETIPRLDLLAELGRRVSNTKNYQNEFRSAGIPTDDVRIPKFTEFEKESFDKHQPLRTDMESILGSKGYVDVEIAP